MKALNNLGKGREALKCFYVSWVFFLAIIIPVASLFAVSRCRFVNYMAKGSQTPLVMCCLMHEIVRLHDFNEVLFSAGCYARSLYFFLCLPDRAPIFGY